MLPYSVRRTQAIPRARWTARNASTELANFGRRDAGPRYFGAGALRSHGHSRFMRQRRRDFGRRLHPNIHAWLRRFPGLITFDQQLIADLGSAAENGVCWELQHTLGLALRHGDSEGTYKFAKSDDFEVFVHQDQVEGKHMPMVCTAFAGTIHTP